MLQNVGGVLILLGILLAGFLIYKGRKEHLRDDYEEYKRIRNEGFADRHQSREIAENIYEREVRREAISRSRPRSASKEAMALMEEVQRERGKENISEKKSAVASKTAFSEPPAWVKEIMEKEQARSKFKHIQEEVKREPAKTDLIPDSKVKKKGKNNGTEILKVELDHPEGIGTEVLNAETENPKKMRTEVLSGSISKQTDLLEPERKDAGTQRKTDLLTENTSRDTEILNGAKDQGSTEMLVVHTDIGHSPTSFPLGTEVLQEDAKTEGTELLGEKH